MSIFDRPAYSGYTACSFRLGPVQINDLSITGNTDNTKEVRIKLSIVEKRACI